MLVVALDYMWRQSFTVSGQRYFVLFDDAMISMRYARNLSSGHGLVYNTVGPAVEGFTNPLWTLWMSFLHLSPLPLRLVSVTVIVSGLGLLIANLYLVERIADRIAPDSSLVTPIAMWLTALCAPIVLWTVLGMEVGLVSLVILLSVLLCLRWQETGASSDLRWLAIVLAISTAVRPDMVVTAVVVSVYAAFRGPSEQRRRALAVLLGAVIASLVAQTMFRLAYYGEPLPNTYYLKVGGISLQTRLKRGLPHLITSGLRQLYAPMLLMAVWFVFARAKRRSADLLLLIVVAQLAYSVYVGGDSYDGGEAGSRYIAVVLPCLLILAALGIEALASLSGRARLTVVGASAATLFLVTLFRAANVTPGGRSQLGPTPRDATLLRVGLPLALLAALAWYVRSARPRDGMPRGATRAAVLGLALALMASFSLQDLNNALRRPSGAASFDSTMTRYALALRAATDEQAVIATGAAGQLGYFSRRQMVDLLGYSDEHIAHLRPASTVFIPGHNKFDLAYSIGDLRPDVVAGTVPRQSAAMRDEILGYGYEEFGNQLFVRRDSTLVDRSALRRFAADPTAGGSIQTR